MRILIRSICVGSANRSTSLVLFFILFYQILAHHANRASSGVVTLERSRPSSTMATRPVPATPRLTHTDPGVVRGNRGILPCSHATLHLAIQVTCFLHRFIL